MKGREREYIGTVGLQMKRKFEAEKNDKVLNKTRKVWVDRASQTGFIGPTVREVFTDMKNELQSSAGFRACYKVVAKCIKQKENRVYDVEGNNLKSKFRVARAGAPVRATELRNNICVNISSMSEHL